MRMETLLNMQAWHDAYAMRHREGEIGVKPYRPPGPGAALSLAADVAAHDPQSPPCGFDGRA
jgi:hypothetical protein